MSIRVAAVCKGEEVEVELVPRDVIDLMYAVFLHWSQRIDKNAPENKPYSITYARALGLLDEIMITQTEHDVLFGFDYQSDSQ